MESFFSRYRNYLVLLLMLVAQVVGLAMQVRRTGAGRNALAATQDGEGVRLIRLWANALVSPPERLFHSSRLGVVGVWQNYFDLRHTRAENQELEKTVDRLRLEQAALLEDAKEGQRLEALMGFQQKYLYSTQAAQVFGTSGSDLSRVFYIDKGSADKLQRDMAVITPDGIVGKVREVFRHSAQVLAINDQNSGAGVILETTRVRGILRGNADGELQIVDLLADRRIQPGEKVLTAGGDQIFPRGMPVGEVEKVVPDPDRDGFIKVMIKPAAHLDRLDEVLVITSTQQRFSPQQQNDLATSEALKGAEAAALDEQRKASTIMAERLPGLTDPNAPPKPVNPNAPQPSLLIVPPAKPLKAIHPDRFSPGAAPDATPAVTTAEEKTRPAADDRTRPSTDDKTRPAAEAKPKTQPKKNPVSTSSTPSPTAPGADTQSLPQSAAPADPQTKPQRNP
jgi:rod shape-determining protein MreC